MYAAHRAPAIRTVPSALLLMGLVGACGTDPVSDPPCTYEDAATCWTLLGLANSTVLSLAETPWGVFAGTLGSGMWRYDARGTWRNQGLGGRVLSGLLYSGALGQPRLLATIAQLGPDSVDSVVMATVDGGASWSASDDEIGGQSGFTASAFSIAHDPQSPARVYVGLARPIMRSDDFGQSWTVVFGTPADAGLAVHSIVGRALPTGSRIWAAGQTDQLRPFVRFTDDDGATWTTTTPPSTGEDLVNTALTDSTNPDQLDVGVLSGIRRTTDAGTSWQSRMQTRRAGLVTDLARVRGRILALADELASAPPGASSMGLYASDDDGLTWDSLPVPPGASGGTRLLVAADGSVLVGTRSGVWRMRLRQ